MKERQTKKNEKIDRGVINDSDDLFSGGLWWKESEQCRNGYICSRRNSRECRQQCIVGGCCCLSGRNLDGVTYTNTSLGMCLTLPDGWQIGTQEQIDAVESAGQQVTGNTDNMGDTSSYEFYIYNPNTGSTIAMMTEDLTFGEVTAQEYANTLAGQLMSYSDQGITYNFNGITDSVIGTSPFVSFAGMAEYQGQRQYLPVLCSDGKWRTDDYNHCHRTGRSRAGRM